MPSASLSFRPICGQFISVFIEFMSKRSRHMAAIRTVTLKLSKRADGVTIGLLLSLLSYGHLLFICGDIEKNPGPPKTSTTRKTRLSTCGPTRSDINIEPPEASLTAQTRAEPEPTLRDVMTLLCSITDSLEQPSQTSLDNETVERNESATTSMPTDISKTKEPMKEATKEPTKEPMKEPMKEKTMSSLLSDMNCKFSELQTNFSQLMNMCTKVQSEVSTLKTKMTELQSENENIKTANSLLHNKVQTLEEKTDRLERQLNRNNLIFHGIPKKKHETNEDCELAVRDLFSNKMELSDDIKVDAVHRVSRNPEAPIVVHFTSYQQKQMILKARCKLQDTSIFVSEDFPSRIRSIRKQLLPFLREAKQSGKKVMLVYDHLVINGERMFLSENGLMSQKQ